MVSIQDAQQRFADAGFSRADRYEEGTKGKGAAWNSAKARAKENFGPAMQEALSRNAFGKGLDKADASDYDNGIKNKGIANWGTGLQAGADKWGQRVQKFTGLWDASLPTSRGPKRSSNNLKRMTENVQRFMDAAK